MRTPKASAPCSASLRHWGGSFSRPNICQARSASQVLSYGFWQRRFGANRQVIGQSLRLEDETYSIIGVLPPHELPGFSSSAALWVPLPPDAARGSRYLAAIGRLKPGLTLARAQTEMSAIAERLEKEYPRIEHRHRHPTGAVQEAIVGDSRKLLLMLLLDHRLRAADRLRQCRQPAALPFA